MVSYVFSAIFGYLVAVLGLLFFRLPCTSKYLFISISILEQQQVGVQLGCDVRRG